MALSTGAPARAPAASARAWGLSIAAGVVLAVASAAAALGLGWADSMRTSLKLLSSELIAIVGILALFAVGPGEDATPRTGHVLRLFLAFLSMGAALVHFATVHEHLGEYWLYGAFFVVVAIAQLVWAAVVVRTASKAWLVVGLIGNLVLAAAWVVTRTVGSLIGPDATEASVVGFGDAVTTAFEVLIVIVVLMLLRKRVAQRAVAPLASVRTTAALALVTLLFTIPAIFSAVGSSPYVSHVG